MSRFATYYVTGVWKDSNGRITDVMLHTVNADETFARGVKTSKTEVIRLLKLGRTVMTLTWGYPRWNRGAYVAYETVNGQEYLRTVANASPKDNLDNSIIYGGLI